jgi:hypothetical protein
VLGRAEADDGGASNPNAVNAAVATTPPAVRRFIRATSGPAAVGGVSTGEVSTLRVDGRRSAGDVELNGGRTA